MKLSIGIYKKSLAFWIVVGLIFGATALLLRRNSQQISASSELPQEVTLPGAFSGTVVIARSGAVTFQGKPVKGTLKTHKDFDEFQLKIFDEPGVSFGQARVDVVLPFSVSEPSIKITPYLIHSFDSQVGVQKIAPSTIEFTATNIAPEAVFTVNVQFGKGLIAYPWLTRIAQFFSTISFGSWIVLSLVLPVPTLLYVLYLLYRQSRVSIAPSAAAVISSPPQDLPPAVVGVLKHGSVSARDIGATLVDLARRGFIDIFWRESGFSFGKRRDFHFYSLAEMNISPTIRRAKTQGLRGYEEVLLSKILPPEGYRSTDDDIVVRVGHRLFSPKMAEVFTQIYSIATAHGFFVKNPAAVHRTIRRRGIALFVAGVIGFAVSGILGPDPKFFLIFWVGMIAASLLIIDLSNLVPLRTPHGTKVLGDWLAFERYLTDRKEISYSEITAGVFERYLPYAIALGVEGAWTYRFRRHPFAPPPWFGTTTNNISLEQFDRELFPLLGWLAQSLVAAKEPTVE